MDEIQIIEALTKYLLERGVEFSEDGFPIFQAQWIIEDLPDAIVPFSKRHYFKIDKKKVSICFFENDKLLYPRFNKLFKEIETLEQYHSVCMMDISVSPFMFDCVQETNLLINMLYSCVLATNGIKIIPSFRSGSFETIQILTRNIGQVDYWIMGAIGTQKVKKNVYLDYLFESKCLILMPKRILIYGKPSKSTISCLNEYGIKYSIYKDFRYLSYKKEKQYVGF